jgi:hypothetical protein
VDDLPGIVEPARQQRMEAPLDGGERRLLAANGLKAIRNDPCHVDSLA